MRNKLGNALWGIILLIIGCGFAGQALDLWDFDMFFDGWWTLFIIVPCAIDMIQKRVNVGNLAGIIIGVLLLLKAQDILPDIFTWSFIFPALIAFVGIIIIFKSFFPSKNVPKMTQCTGNVKNIAAIFGGQEARPNNEVFNGSDVSAIFGGVELDLRQAIINEDIVINITAVFGGVDLYVPANTKIEVTSVPILGGVSNKAMTNANPNCPTIYINATCVFGGVEIK